MPGRKELIELLSALPKGSFSVTREEKLTSVQFPVDVVDDPDDVMAGKPNPTPFPRLTLGQVLKEQGAPEVGYGWIEGGGGMLCQVVILEYPARGLRVESFGCNQYVDVEAFDYDLDWLRADSQSPVFRIDYYTPTTLQGALRNVYDLSDREVQCILGKARWEGLEKVPDASECG